MELNFKRTNKLIEIICLSMLFLQFLFIFTFRPYKFSINLPPLIINLFLYLLLSLIFYFSTSPSIILKKFKKPELFGHKSTLSQNQILFYLKKGVLFSGLFKLTILFIPFGLQLITNIFLMISVIFPILFTFIILCLGLYILTVSINYFLKANGFESLTLKQTIIKGLFYYNPDDKRAVVEKQFGIGTTINFASKQGRLILYVIISIPITITLLLLLVMVLSKKL